MLHTEEVLEVDEKEKMLSGLPYMAWKDTLPGERLKCKKLLRELNLCDPEDPEKADRLIRKLFGKAGKNIEIFLPFYCDYGSNIEIGDNFFASYNCVMVDCGKIIIGNNTMLAAGVIIAAAGHPVHPEPRVMGYEYGMTTVIGSNVWIGAGTVVNPGVTIGDNTVIGSGSVVTKDIPDGVIAVGNPCRVLRTVTDEDRMYYFKKRRFDDAGIYF